MILLVAGEESAGAQALRLAVERGHEVVAALTTPDDAADASDGSPAGPKGQQPGVVAKVARELGVARLDPGLVRDPAYADWIRERRVDLMLNVHSLRIAHGDVVSAPRLGSYNLHPGPLPRYAGLNAPSWAIYEGEERHAVTLHRMAADVDAGAIAYEAWFDIGPADTGLRVATACVRHGVALLGQLLDDAAQGPEHIPARPQDLTQRRWYARGAPNGGRVVWDEPARRIVDLVRASNYAPFPSPWGWPVATLDARREGRPEGAHVELVRVAATGDVAGSPPGTVGDAVADGVRVAAGDEWVTVQRVRVGGEAADPADVLAAGSRFTAA
jgi:UDP-4-amino-4-deoxy-L-arabinose formyltransferase/UDP-glucuronic acid dehydrogenase (UDP-4-keto-hexauronic acid decarboxylating)